MPDDGAMKPEADDMLSPYQKFTRAEWAALRADTPMTLSEEDVEQLSGLIERVSTDEVREVYLPLSRLLNLYVGAAQTLHEATSTFLGNNHGKTPFIIGLAGSVAVGKSTTGRVLQALLARWPNHPRVDLIATDGFLWPNAELERRGLMERKGFPQSYDQAHLRSFMADVKAGKRNVVAPVYSHFHYDVLPGENECHRPAGYPDCRRAERAATGAAAPGRQGDPVCLGLFRLLDLSRCRRRTRRALVCGALHAAAADGIPGSGGLLPPLFENCRDKEATKTAERIWKQINLKNLKQNILPTRQRADLILHKTEGHVVDEVALRKL